MVFFVTEAVPASQGQVTNVWMMAHWHKKVNKRQIKKTNVSNVCEGLMKPTQPIPLRHYGQCLLGLSRIHLKQVEYLHADCNEAVSKLKIRFKKTNVDLDPEKKTTDAAITLGPNDKVGDNTLMNIKFGNDNEHDLMNDDNQSDTMSAFHIPMITDPLNTGSGSHGIGMLATRSTINELNEFDNDNESISGIGDGLSDINKNGDSILQQYQAKEHEIHLNESNSHVSADSPLRRISSLGKSSDALPYEDTQNCDIEIDFGDDDGMVFDENDAQSVNGAAAEDIEVVAPPSVEHARHAINDINDQMNSINISNVNNNDGIEQLSAIKGPKPHIDMASISDVASVASVHSDNLSHHSHVDDNVDINMGLDESMGAPLEMGVMPAPMDIHVADNISVASLSTVELQEQEKQKEMRTQERNEQDIDTDDENDNNNNNNNDNNKNNKKKQVSKNKSKNKGGKDSASRSGGKSESLSAKKKYKKSRKARFLEETDSNGEVEMDLNDGSSNNNSNNDKDGYILCSRDILQMWREKPVRSMRMEDMMNYPIAMANNLFGGGFGANYGNITHEFNRFMPKDVLTCYNNILNDKAVENDGTNVGYRRESNILMDGMDDDDDNENENENDNNENDDIMFAPEFARDDENGNENLNHFDENDNDHNNNNILPLIDGSNDGSLHDESEQHESYLKQKKLRFDGNTTILDAVVDDNVYDLDAPLINENELNCPSVVIPIVDDMNETKLEQGNKDEELEDSDIDIDIENKRMKQGENENNENNKNNNKEKEGMNQVNKIGKFRSWSRRTQKTLQYLDSKKDENTFSFNEMAKESNKRETVAGVFYEMLVLKNADLVEMEQTQPFGDITISKTDQFEEYANKVRMVRMSQV